MIYVEIIDTYPIYSQGLVSVLSAAGCKIMAVRSSFSQGLSWRANIVLADPDAVAGVLADEFAAQASSNTPTLLLLPPSTEIDPVARCASLGAQGYVARDVPAEQLVRAVRVVADGGRYMDGVRAPAPPTESLADRDILSPRERQVLRQIARGMTHSQVARAMGISRHTVDTYVKRIRSKLELGNKAELTLAAVLGGYSGSRHPAADSRDAAS